MTHSLYFRIVTEDHDHVKSLLDKITQDEEFMDLWNLRYQSWHIDQKGGVQPFFYFPKKDEVEDDGTYTITIETGSHVAVSDTNCALHWYFFVQAFVERFKADLEIFEMYYQYEGRDDKIDKNLMLESIQTGDERLSDEVSK